MYKNVYRPISHLDRAPQIHVGGLCWIYAFLWEDVVEWPTLNPLTGTITEALELKAGAELLRVRPIERNRFFQEEEKSSTAGDYVEVRLNFRLAGNTVANALTLSRMKYHQWGFLVKERDGFIRLIGDADSGARKNSNYSSGHGDNHRGHDVQFVWEHPESIPFYEETMVLVGGSPITIGTPAGSGSTPSGLTEFSEEFTTEFN